MNRYSNIDINSDLDDIVFVSIGFALLDAQNALLQTLFKSFSSLGT